MGEKISDTRVVGTSLLVSVGDVVLNLLVGLLTGSAVMMSQALQGLSDLTTAAILFTGVKRSRRPADTLHPLGYGREIFFWVLVAGIVMFFGTGALSIYLGYQQIADPEPIANIWLAFLMLTFGLATNGYSFNLSLKRLRSTAAGRNWLRELASSSLIETKATLLVDMLGTAAAVLGSVSLGIYALTGMAAFDGWGAVAIGVSMMLAALLLFHDVKDLIVGKAVDVVTAKEIESAVKGAPHVRAMLDLHTMYLGSSRMLVLVEVHLDPHLQTREIETVLDDIKSRILEQIPGVVKVQVEVETPDKPTTR
jgi:cation diffusion facilitator family transporter